MKCMYGESFLSGRISPENEIESEEKVSGKRKTPAKGVIYHKKGVIYHKKRNRKIQCTLCFINYSHHRAVGHRIFG